MGAWASKPPPPPPPHAHMMCAGRVEGQGPIEHIWDIIYDTPCKYDHWTFGLDMRKKITICELFTLVKILPWEQEG